MCTVCICTEFRSDCNRFLSLSTISTTANHFNRKCSIVFPFSYIFFRFFSWLFCCCWPIARTSTMTRIWYGCISVDVPATTMFSKFKSGTSQNIIENNPIAQHFEIGKQTACAGPEFLWRIHDAVRKCDGRVSILYTWALPSSNTDFVVVIVVIILSLPLEAKQNRNSYIIISNSESSLEQYFLTIADWFFSSSIY